MSGTLYLQLCTTCGNSPDTFRRHLKTHYFHQAVSILLGTSLLTPQIRHLLDTVRAYVFHLNLEIYKTRNCQCNVLFVLWWYNITYLLSYLFVICQADAVNLSRDAVEPRWGSTTTLCLAGSSLWQRYRQPITIQHWSSAAHRTQQPIRSSYTLPRSYF